MGAKQVAGTRPGRQGNMELGRLLYEAREKIGITRSQLADIIGRNRSMISLWENGQSPITNDETISALSDALGIPKDEIYAAGDYVPADIWVMLCEMSASELGQIRQILVGHQDTQ